MRIIVPVSGGKDSQATLLLALATGRPVLPVFYYTGWDHPAVDSHLAYMERHLDLTIHRTRHAKYPTMVDLIEKYQRFPWGAGRFCTSAFKREAFRDWLDTVDGEFELWLGMRSDESVQRRNRYAGLDPEELIPLNEFLPKKYPARIHARGVVRLPLLNYSTTAVFGVIADAGMQACPLYAQGFDRVGCFPCLLAGKETQERAFATEFGRQQFATIQKLEQRIGEKYKFQPNTAPCELCQI